MEKDECGDNEHFLVEIRQLRQRIAELEKSGAGDWKEGDPFRVDEEQFRRLVENSPFMIYRMSLPDGAYEYVSAASTELTGYAPEEWYKNPLLARQIIHPEFSLYFDDEWTRLLEGRASPHYEFKFVHKSGEERWAYQANTIIHNSTGRPVAIEGVVTDITEHKRAEEELRQSEAKYRTLLESINDGVFIVDRDRRFTFVNDIIVERSGRSRESFAGRDFLDVIQPEYRELATKNFEADMRGETLPPYEVALNYPGSTRHGRWIEINRKPLWDGNRVVGVLGVSRDVTARRQMEEELLRNRALESLGTLAGGIAHDFNNLLMAVTGYISIAKITLPPDGEEFRFLSEAERISLAGKELTQKLIAFSRGGTSPRSRMVLNPLIEYMSRIALSGSNVECSFSLSGNLLPVEADETQIGQVIHNVVVNAREAMPGGGSIHITTSNVTVPGEEDVALPPGDYVRISVEDYGAGIREEDLPKIFDPYFTTKDMGPTKGMGLGLAIAYSAVKKHNGIISVASASGQGTTVDIYLPASRELPAAAPREGAPRSSRKKILFMDDDENVRNIGEKLISLLGYDVVLAKNGNEAVDHYTSARAANEPFDAAILDLTVRGGMGGREAFEKLKSEDPQINAIISSGYADDPVIANFREHGFKGAMTKPYRVEELKEMLEKAVNSE